MITSYRDYLEWFSSAASEEGAQPTAEHDKIQIYRAGEDFIPDEMDLSEKYFDVDLNRRRIRTPEQFVNLAMEGDIKSETIYFRMNRYFDNKDLKKADVVIVYTNADDEMFTHVVSEKNKFVVSGGQVDFGSSEEEELEKDILLIGWTLPKKLTKKAGVVSFGLTFYSKTEVGDRKYVDYALNVQPTEANILQGHGLSLEQILNTNTDSDISDTNPQIVELQKQLDALSKKVAELADKTGDAFRLTWKEGID